MVRKSTVVELIDRCRKRVRAGDRRRASFDTPAFGRLLRMKDMDVK
jgi:hypothetical protein